MDALGLVMTSMADLIKEEIANPALETVTRTEEVQGLALMVKEKAHQAVILVTMVIKTEGHHLDILEALMTDLHMAKVQMDLEMKMAIMDKEKIAKVDHMVLTKTSMADLIK